MMLRFLSGLLCMVLLMALSADAQARQGRGEARTKELTEVQAPMAVQEQQFKPKQIKMDRNNDGNIDRIETYSVEGVIIKSETDTTGNTKIDEWIFYEEGRPVRVEKDLTGDGVANSFLTYNTEGILVKIETDTTGNTKIDEWVYYENGRPVRAEKDTSGDGQPDTWIEY